MAASGGRARRRQVLGALLAACAGRPAWAATARPRADVVSVGGDITEIVCALGARARLAGVDSTSTWPADLADLPRVGYLRQLGAEGVLSLRASLVLAAAQAGPPVVLEQLRAAGMKVVTLPAGYGFDVLRHKVSMVGAALGMADAAAALNVRLQADWEQAQAVVRVARQRASRVLFLLAHGGSPQMAGEDTAAGTMLRLAGARNALGGVRGYKPLGAEALVAAAPDLLLTTNEGLQAIGGREALLGLPGMALTPAGTAARVLSFDAMYLLGFGPRLPQAVADLARALAAARA